MTEVDEANNTVVSVSLNDPINEEELISTNDILENINTSTTKSPSISSISSIESNSSTDKLIKSLSSTKLTTKDDQTSTTSGTESSTTTIRQVLATTNDNKPNRLPQSVASKTNFYNDLNEKNKNQLPQKKKPIKFTVRKVSHEPVNINSSSNSSSPTTSRNPTPTSATSSKFSFTDKNIEKPKNNDIKSPTTTDQHEVEIISKLKQSQQKYDQYEIRIIKIEKEIEFLLQLLPPYNVEIDYNTRTKINKAIEKLKLKQEEIIMKKYNLGIVISRLWRNHESSEIWVRKFD
ncbi:hypothetical protein KGF54_003559 [Candida jiufengensis]|uniref:uncharacterized protein n=1 Tax=Candida jiufengensis TaxID=497108 RepID=UPI0022254CF9|nr:uncharacterized protein KGF54_003559 [Candida jiufengensis]KAI5952692.1 hypothetical protein KGF54_003559 [Candida jiufengensis]